jgi:hypothetical protein
MERRLTLLQRLDRAARAALPTTLAVVLLVLSGVPLGLPGLRGLAPAFALPIVFFWSIWRRTYGVAMRSWSAD